MRGFTPTSMVNKQIFWIGVLFASCNIGCKDRNNNSNSEKHNLTKTIDDSVRIYFRNTSTNEIDSLSAEFTSKLFTKSGVNLEKMLAAVSLKDSNSYDYYKNFAYALIINKKPKEALQLLRLAKTIVHEKSKYYLDLALTWAAIEPLLLRDSTHHYFDQAIANDPDNPYYYAVSAAFYGEEGDYENALRKINKAITLAQRDLIRSCQDTTFINVRGALKVAMKDYQGGLKDMQPLSSDNLKESEFYFWRGVAFLNLKNYVGALEEAEKSIALNPQSGTAYLLCSSALYKLKRKDEALENLKIAVGKGDSQAVRILDKKFPDWRKTKE